MAGELWRNELFWGKEVTPGTPVDVDRRIYVQDVSFSKEQSPRPYMFDTGTRDNVRAMTLGSVVAGGSMTQYVSADEIIEILMLAVNGTPTISTPMGATDTRDWVFVPGDLASATVEWYNGAHFFQIPGVRVNTLTIEGNVREENNVTAEIFATDVTRESAFSYATTEPPERSVSFFEGWETKLYIDAFGGTPGSTNPGCSLLSWNVSVNNQLGRKYCANNTQAASAVVSGVLEITASLTVEASSAMAATEFDNWDARTRRLVSLEFGNNAVIEGAFNRILRCDIPGQWSAVDISGDDEGTRVYELSLQYIYDPTNAFGIRFRARNSRADLAAAFTG